MKESEAKKKQCPHLSIQHSIALLTANIVKGDDNDGVAEKMRGINAMRILLCSGSGCMMWEKDIEIEYKDIDAVRIEKDNESAGFVIPDGWEIQAHLVEGKIEIKKYVDSDSGDCGLKTKELYCEGGNQ